jgi:RNA polymerase sigma-70 factor (ECF subfamily)
MTPTDELAVAVEQAQAGDGRGFEALFGAFGGQIAGFLRARNVSDPEAVTNDVFVRAFRAIHTFRGDSARFRVWLFTIARHAAIDDARRRRRRVEEVPLDGVPEAVGGDVEDDAATHLAGERVTALLQRLSPDQRDVLVLRIVADLSVDETAAVLGKSYEGVKALQRRGLASLRRHISDPALSDRLAVPR